MVQYGDLVRYLYEISIIQISISICTILIWISIRICMIPKIGICMNSSLGSVWV